MLSVERPPIPPGFNDRARAARATIRGVALAGGRPAKEHFVDHWSEFKAVLAGAQHDRCGYCECEPLVSDDGTVDHFRPKGRIETLGDDPTTWGKETAHSASLPDRECEKFSDSGYHWLAYVWENYVFACMVCNVKFKGCLFPVARHPRRCPPRRGDFEEPLLLHCYRSDARPSEHLKFNADGSVEAFTGSAHGWETIRTVGLDRQHLRTLRGREAGRAHDAVDKFEEGEQASARRDLLRLGAVERPFAGVVRAIVEQRLGVHWEVFAAASGAPNGAARGLTPA